MGELERYEESREIRWNFHGEKLIVTRHAVERFEERWPEYSVLPLHEPVQRLKRLFFAANPEEVGTLFRAYRALSSRNFHLADYYRYEKWRFIVVKENGSRFLVTAELDHWGYLSRI